MIRLVREYINYWIKGKNRHGVHSPFVFDFNDKCLRTAVPENVRSLYSDYYNQLRNSDQKIIVDDFGAGSKKLGNKRKVQSIAKISGSSAKYANLIYKIVHYYQPGHILELGTSLGLSTLMMRLGNRYAEIDTIEGCRQTLEVTQQQFPTELKEKINFHRSTFDAYLTKTNKPKTYDFIFVDGDHRGESVLKVLDLLNTFIHDETIILLDDIRWTEDMQSMWYALIASGNYHVSIDLFKMGIIVPRKHQATENFVIRY
jgi:predicted O-methyltransferase YrrM